MCASDSGMSDPSRMVVGVAGPVSFYNGGSDHFATDHFLEQFLPVRRENNDNIENILDDMEHGVEELSGPKSCLNVTCHPEPFCAKYIMVPGECCARCSMAIRQWRSCRHCTPTEGCLKYRAPKRGQGCCATCVKRKNRFSGKATHQAHIVQHPHQLAHTSTYHVTSHVCVWWYLCSNYVN